MACDRLPMNARPTWVSADIPKTSELPYPAGCKSTTLAAVPYQMSAWPSNGKGLASRRHLECFLTPRHQTCLRNSAYGGRPRWSPSLSKEVRDIVGQAFGLAPLRIQPAYLHRFLKRTSCQRPPDAGRWRLPQCHSTEVRDCWAMTPAVDPIRRGRRPRFRAPAIQQTRPGAAAWLCTPPHRK